MRFHTVLPLTAVLATAFVVPDEQVMRQVSIENNQKHRYLSGLADSAKDVINGVETTIESAWEDAAESVNEAVDNVYNWAGEKSSQAEDWLNDFRDAHEADFDFTSGMDEETMHTHWNDMKAVANEWRSELGLEEAPCHDGPPRRGGPDKYRRPYGDDPRSPHPPGPPGPPSPPPGHDDREHPPHPPHPPHEKPPHHKKPHHHKPNETVYQVISRSKYTTKLAKLINEFPEVVEKLNGTESNFTFFAPTDKAFEKIPKHGRDPPKEFLLKLLQYHVVPDVYPAPRVLKTRTLPTVLEGTYLSDSPKKTVQRLSINLGLKGLTLNFYARVIPVNVVATNGIIHGLDSILVPPPKVAKIIQFLPGEFSTLELGLFKTGLIAGLNDTSNHLGGTLFAPSNGAFQKLGAKANAFLFSQYGRKYLKAILEYHVVPNITLYSDALYTAHKPKDSNDMNEERTFHIDLPTLLKGKDLSIDVARFIRFLDIRINGFYHVAITDGIAKDGSIHVVGDVLIPPKTPGSYSEYVSGEISVEELVERLDPYVSDEDRVDSASLEL